MFWFMLLIVLGGVSLVFSFAFRFFGVGGSASKWCGWWGTGIWVLAMVLFYFFWSDPQPKHSRRR